MSKYSTSAHSTHNIGYHVIFCPKYRHHLLRHRTASELKRILTAKASNLGIIIQTMEVMPDYVHLFVNAAPSISIDFIVSQLKGHSSYLLRKQFNHLRKYPTLWTRFYFVETIGHISEKTVVKYIENQKSKAFSSPD